MHVLIQVLRRVGEDFKAPKCMSVRTMSCQGEVQVPYVYMHTLAGVVHVSRSEEIWTKLSRVREAQARKPEKCTAKAIFFALPALG